MSSWDAFKSERQSIYFDQINNMTTKEAPFGTNDTPVITWKIIGGKSVPVMERHVRQDDFNTARLQPLEPIAPKVNHTDPRQYGDQPYADVQDYFNPAPLDQPHAGGSRPDYPRNDYAKNESHRSDYLRIDHSINEPPRNDYPRNDYPKNEPPRNDYPRNEPPRNDYPRNDYPRNEPSRNEYPRSAPPRQDHPRKEPQGTIVHQGYEDPTTLVSRRPDSKDLHRTSYAALPPILQNRTRNDMSTVFETEPWTGNKTPPLATDTEYKTHYDPHQEKNAMARNAQPSYNPPVQQVEVTQREMEELMNVVPRSVFLPLEPVKYTRDQELTLYKLVYLDLVGLKTKALENVYMDCSQGDRDFRGYCDYQHLENALNRNKVPLRGDTARLIAAQYVDPEGNRGVVNYEEFLRFVGRALEYRKSDNFYNKTPTQSDSSRQNSSRPGGKKFYNTEAEQYKFGSLYKQRQVAKLLRNVHDQLSDRNYDLDFSKWYKLFQENDRENRGTLSGSQIKNLCYQLKLPLQDSLINSVLELCEGNNRDGQYRWSTFLEFLSRVKPQNTGLPIPVSKRPLEYAKHFPQPVANWPRADDGRQYEKERQPARREPSPARSPRRYDDQRESPRRDYEQRRDVSPRRDPGYPDRYRDRGRDGSMRANVESRINELTNQLHDLEEKNARLRDYY